MFDLPVPVPPSVQQPAPGHVFLQASRDPDPAFAVTTPDRNPAATLAGEARPKILARFGTLAEAMLGAIAHADGTSDGTPQMLAILDREDRLVLAGVAAEGAVAWCQPVASAAEARAVVTEASQLRAQAGRAAGWQEGDLATRLRHRAELLEARLVDPLWRAFAARALQVAA